MSPIAFLYRYAVWIIIAVIIILLLLVGIKWMPVGGIAGGNDNGNPNQPGIALGCSDVCKNANYETGYGPVSDTGGCAGGYIPFPYGSGYCCCQAPSSQPRCTDTDAGNDIYKTGTCYDGRSITDDCYSQSMVNENWCSDGICMGATEYCPTGYICWEGSCIRMQQSCTSILYPKSQRDCDGGACTRGACTYHAATLSVTSYCSCDTLD